MTTVMKAAGKWGGILAFIALLVVALKQVIALIGIISFAVKALIVLAFFALLIGVAFMIYRAWSDRKKAEQSF